MIEQSMSSANDLKITFYSTSPPENSKSKYPKQNKTSYIMPSSAITTGANITVPAHVHEEEPLATYRSLPRDKRRSEANKKSEKQKITQEKKQKIRDTDTTQNQPTRSHPIRIRNAPMRYEPVEHVTDDYKAEEHDSDSDYSSD